MRLNTGIGHFFNIQDSFRMQNPSSNTANQYIPSPNNFRRNRIVLVSLIIMAVMSWFCAMTPWLSDDYAFAKNGAGLWATLV